MNTEQAVAAIRGFDFDQLDLLECCFGECGTLAEADKFYQPQGAVRDVLRAYYGNGEIEHARRLEQAMIDAKDRRIAGGL